MTPNIESAFRRSNAEVHLGNAGYTQCSVGDAQAQFLIDEAIQIQRFEADMVETYAARLSAVLPAVKVARYL